jgi:hypothetical protein
VTLKAPPLSAFGDLATARRGAYAGQLAAAQAQAERNVLHAIPEARIRWRFRIVANGFAVVLPEAKVPLLARVPGIANAWPSVTYHRREALGPEQIGAEKLWGAGLATAGNGIKIGIIDDGVQAAHEYFAPRGLAYPPGFPKGQTKYTTPKVIVQRTFAPPSPDYDDAKLPFDPSESFHATHVAGIAAGDHDTKSGTVSLSGVAPRAYIGNYKALTIPTPDFGLDGNAAEIAAAIEAAVRDGMDVINLSLGEPEIEPSRDIVVRAIEGAARAGVVPVIAAGNDFSDFGYGSISSPANAPSAITVAAVTSQDVIASFSSGGPTPVSLQLKPDVSAPGVAVTSSLPRGQGGPFGPLQGTSMASPHVAGGVALLKQQRPNWTVAQIKSALVQTAGPVKDERGREVSVLREGGGLINLPRALDPLLFAAPTGVTFAANGGAASVSLTDAGDGAGAWTVSIVRQGATGGITVDVPATVDVPGKLELTAKVPGAAPSGAFTGFVVLTHGTDTRRIPYLVVVDRPVLASLPRKALTRPGVYSGTTAGGTRKVVRYRYPSAGDGSYPGPETVYRIRLASRPANFGVAVLSGRVMPHVVYAGNENHLAGYAGLPVSLNPYFDSFGSKRAVAGAILPLPGAYDIVFDTRAGAHAGPFQFRYWVNDTKPPQIRLLPSDPGQVAVGITDAGAGVDAASIEVTVDGSFVNPRYADGKLVFPVETGQHMLVVEASDFQELKNNEDVAKIKPNTTHFARAVVVG